MSGSSRRAEVAARALRPAVDGAVVVVVSEVPVGRVDGSAASPARELLAGVHASLVGGACALVGGVGVAVGSCASRLVSRSLVFGAASSSPLADGRALEAGSLHASHRSPTPTSMRVSHRVTDRLSQRARQGCSTCNMSSAVSRHYRFPHLHSSTMTARTSRRSVCMSSRTSASSRSLLRRSASR